MVVEKNIMCEQKYRDELYINSNEMQSLINKIINERINEIKNVFTAEQDSRGEPVDKGTKGELRKTPHTS